MPIVVTFDIQGAPPQERNRIQSFFERLGWQNLGGSSYRYPRLGTQDQPVEDWFNHVIPALAYFRSLVCHANLNVYNFTIDAHSEAGHRGKALPPLGEPIKQAADITLYPSSETALSEQRLRAFVQACADDLA